MTLSTFNSLALERCTVRMPQWGLWTADCVVAADKVLSGVARINLAGLELVGTITNGGVYQERGHYQVVAGAGGWRSTIPAKAYRNEAGVKLSAVVADAASACDETIGTVTDRRIGPGYFRARGEAARTLDLLASELWYVDELGVTHVRARPSSEFSAQAYTLNVMPSGGGKTIAAESITGLVPGATVGGMVAASVRHELTPDMLRSHVYAGQDGLVDRSLGAIRRIVQAITRPTFFHAVYEYRVAGVSAGYIDAQPSATGLGLPDLASVPMRVGVPGGGGEPVDGSTVLIGFVNGDPTRPYVHSYEGEGLDGWLPSTARVEAAGRVYVGGAEVSNPGTATGRFIRWGDQIPHPVSGVPLPLAPHASNPTMAKAGSA